MAAARDRLSVVKPNAEVAGTPRQKDHSPRVDGTESPVACSNDTSVPAAMVLPHHRGMLRST